MDNVIFIAWNKYHTRNDSVSRQLNIKSYHIGKNQKNRFHSILSYLIKTIATIRIINKEKPKTIIVTNTVFVLPAVCLIIGKIKNIHVVLDTHTRGIHNSFFAYPKCLRVYFARIAALNLVTNTAHFKIVKSWGAKAFVLPDPPLLLAGDSSKFNVPANRINICFINTYSEDEPYNEVIACAGKLKDVNFYITGNCKDINLPHLPNLVYTGFLERSKYLALLSNADILMTLTTRDDTFQCGGNEALSLGKPLITSDTKMLRAYFHDSCVYVRPVAESIETGIHVMIANINLYKERIKKLLMQAEFESDLRITSLKKLLV